MYQEIDELTSLVNRENMKITLGVDTRYEHHLSLITE